MIRRLAILSLLMLPLPAAAQDDASAALRDFLDGTQTLRAAFRQSLFTEHSPDPQVSEGMLYLKRPGRFRWEYVQPTGQLVVCDGQRIWMYDQDLEQVTVRPVDDTLQGTPAMLLSGQASLDETFDVVDSFDDDGLAWVVLQPKAGSPEFVSLRIGLADGIVQRMELLDSLGQATRIELSGVVTDAELDEGLFVFDPPEGADVIGQGGSL